ncbi:MAG TPA: carbamate kinase, partial [Marinobacter adhaerens]|nr:carbamate kinase [Marinobacter adhaerens]
NVQIAARSLAAVVRAGHDLVVTHGNGPQVGLLALQGASYKPDEAYPLDVLGAETEGMIGYMIEQELENAL